MRLLTKQPCPACGSQRGHYLVDTVYRHLDCKVTDPSKVVCNFMYFLTKRNYYFLYFKDT